MRFPRRLRPLLLLGFALLLYLPLLGRRDIVTGHEARVAQTAREMARTWPWQNTDADRLHVDRVVLTDIGSGVLRLYPATDGSSVSVNPWLVPVLKGLIRLQKPPLSYWCAAVPLKLFSAGNMGQGWARLVPALMGAFAVLFIYDLARLTIGRAGAWAAGLVWVSSYLPFEEYRLAMPDPYLAFFTLVCVWAWARNSKTWGVGGEGVRSAESARQKLLIARLYTPPPHSLLPTPSPAVFILFYISLALGVLSKGPLIFVHVGIALGAYHACYRTRLPGRLWQHLLGIAVFAAVAAPWVVYVYRQVPDAIAVWRYESVGELSNNRENVRPWWFYIPAALQISLPWAPVWLAGLVLPFVRRRKGDRRPFFPLIWYGATVIFFSLVNQKKNPYLLPVLPAQVLLTARALVALLAHARLTWARGGKGRRRDYPHPRSLPEYRERGQDTLVVTLSRQEAQTEPPSRRDEAGYLLGAQAALGVGCAVVLSVFMYRENPNAPLAVVWLSGIAALAAGLVPLWLLLRRPRRWLAAQAVAYAVLVLLAFEGVITPRDNRRSARPVCEVAAPRLLRPGTTILTNVLAEEAAVYLPLGINYGPGHRVLIIFDDQENVTLRKKAGKFARYVPGQVPPGDGPVDEMYLRKWDTWLGGGRVIDARRIPVPGESGDVRWKLFELTVDRKTFAAREAPAAPVVLPPPRSYILRPTMARYFVTGGAGFIGSNVVDRLLADGHAVTAYDNFSTGQRRFLAEAIPKPGFRLIEGDMLDEPRLAEAVKGHDFVFHFAANADVRFGTDHPRRDLEQNTIATYNVLEAMRAAGMKRIGFSSTGSVYGEPDVFPTPETCPFPVQTSLYAASKLAGEALIQAFSSGFGFQGYIFRFVSILGPRYSHGHVFDFYRQLSEHPDHVKVLGNGKQRKSYLYVQDCVDAMLTVTEKSCEPVNIFNLGTEEYCAVDDSIGWIGAKLGMSPRRDYAGGERGWIGDSPFIFLDTKKARSLGWKPKLTIRQGVESTVEYLRSNPWLFEAR